jgi:phage terminase small subunit
MKEITMTIKQEDFAYAYLQTGNASEAYRKVYNTKNMTDTAIHVEASRLTRHPTVALILNEQRSVVAHQHKITHNDVISGLKDVISRASEQGDLTNMRHGWMGIARLMGFDKEPMQQVNIQQSYSLREWLEEMANK